MSNVAAQSAWNSVWKSDLRGVYSNFVRRLLRTREKIQLFAERGLTRSPTELAGSAFILCGMMLYSMSAKKNISVPEGVVFKVDSAPPEFDSVLVILKDAAKWVLARNSVRGGWEFPGGHREAGEDYVATAHREALEEAGVTIRDLRYVGFYELQKQKESPYDRCACRS